MYRPGSTLRCTAASILVFLIASVQYLDSAGAARITRGTDEKAKLPYWEYRDQGISLRLVQRLPDQSRGYFLARGFTQQDVELIAQVCVFQTIFKNISHESTPDPVTYDLREWMVTADNVMSRILTREDWQETWSQRGAPSASQIAFKWSLFPTRQTYQAGDYNWGMTMFDLKSGAHFDLEIVWHQYGQTRSALIEGIQCAPDIAKDPLDQ